jgi:hypothetical protein
LAGSLFDARYTISGLPDSRSNQIMKDSVALGAVSKSIGIFIGGDNENISLFPQESP